MLDWLESLAEFGIHKKAAKRDIRHHYYLAAGLLAARVPYFCFYRERFSSKTISETVDKITCEASDWYFTEELPRRSGASPASDDCDGISHPQVPRQRWQR
jgi:hypothetical protein